MCPRALQAQRLKKQPNVQYFLSSCPDLAKIISKLDHEEQYLLLCLPAMGQEHVLALPSEGQISG